MREGDQATYKCESGYSLDNGENEMLSYCQADGEWSERTAKCLSKWIFPHLLSYMLYSTSGFGEILCTVNLTITQRRGVLVRVGCSP